MRLFDHLAVIDDGVPRSAALQMALDEVLLLGAQTTPLLRFYTWARPAVTFGYFGRFDEVKQFAPERDLARRWTGGGIVFHGDDLTYSLVVPRSHAACAERAVKIYERVHLAMQSVLAAAGVDAQLLRTSKPRVSDACFSNPVTADLLAGGNKIAGAAQRRSRAGLLQQGSIRAPHLPVEFREHFAAALGRSCTGVPVDAATEAAAEMMAAKRYASDAWLKMR